MELFEILFLLVFFIVFPLLEQLKRKQRGPDEDGPETPPTPPGEIDRPSADREPVKAADMVPDDLWAVLTGEDRSAGTTTAEGADGVDMGDAPWSRSPEPEPEPEPEPAPWEVDDEATAPEPVSLEYEGPEAYSLEEYRRKAVSLERPVPSAEARHRRFHELVDRPRRRRRRRTSPVARALRDPDSLRQAFVLSEVLAPPKGLE